MIGDEQGENPASAPGPRPTSRPIFSFQGRYGRRRFWLGALGIVGLMLLMLLPLAAMNDPRGGQGGPALLVLLALLLIGLYGKLVIHRLHDLGLSGRWFLLLGPLLIGLPILMYRESNDVYLRIEQSYVAQQAVQGYVLFMLVGSFALFIGGFVVLGCVPGTNGPNRYGPDPRKRAERSA